MALRGVQCGPLQLPLDKAVLGSEQGSRGNGPRGSCLRRWSLGANCKARLEGQAGLPGGGAENKVGQEVSGA